jgi:hypothetical protein
MWNRAQCIRLYAFAFIICIVGNAALLSGATAQDAPHGTVGWYASATGTVGITRGQTLRLSVVNVGVVDAEVHCGLWQNPKPIAVVQNSSTLPPAHGKDCDLKAADIPGEHFDKTGRVQVRAIVRSSAPNVLANLEVFDDQTGRTSLVLSVQELVRPK